MRIGIGLPAAVPGADMGLLGEWAAEAEASGFDAVGVIDRLVYDNLEPLTALAAAAVRTTKAELLTTVLNVGWRRNAVLLAKQLASVDLLSGGRLTCRSRFGRLAGRLHREWCVQRRPRTVVGLDAEHLAASVDRQADRRRRPDDPAGPRAGLVCCSAASSPAAHRRAAAHGAGWVAPLFGTSTLADGVIAVREAWREAGRTDDPRIATGRYFALGPDADADADNYIRHYYGDNYFNLARADTLTTPTQLHDHLSSLRQAGCTDVILYPASAAPDQVHRLAAAVHHRDLASLRSG